MKQCLKLKVCVYSVFIRAVLMRRIQCPSAALQRLLFWWRIPSPALMYTSNGAMEAAYWNIHLLHLYPTDHCHNHFNPFSCAQ